VEEALLPAVGVRGGAAVAGQADGNWERGDACTSSTRCRGRRRRRMCRDAPVPVGVEEEEAPHGSMVDIGKMNDQSDRWELG